MICDTSGLLAALAADQNHHEACVAALEGADQLVLSPMVLSDVEEILAREAGADRAVAAMREYASGAYEIAAITPGDVSGAADIMETYRDLRLGLGVACLVVLAKRYNTNEILTLDRRKLRPIRGLDGRHFKLLPFDLD